MMTADALKYLEATVLEAAGKTVIIEGKEYSTTPLMDPRKPPKTPDPLVFMGLQGVVDFCKSHAAGIKQEAIISVEGWEDVSVYGMLDPEWATRPCYATVDIEGVFSDKARLGRTLDHYHPHEQFMIFVMTEFVDCPERERLLGFVGKVMQEKVQSSEDDVSPRP